MSKGKLLAVCLVWLFLAGVVAVTYRTLFHDPQRKRQYEQTSSSSNYEHSVDFALDSFSGYAIVRSPEYRRLLGEQKIRLNLKDDGADYVSRMRALESGDVQVAVFTVDALIKVAAAYDDIPATIVAIVDETRGADAMVAYKSAIPNIDALNDPGTKFFLTPDSPSETLARVVMAQFNLDKVSAQSFVSVKDAEQVYKTYRQAAPDAKQVYVLWEPFVSKMLENPNTHIVADSSRFRGYIVDVLVANRDFLYKNPDVVQQIVGQYFRAHYHYRKELQQLILADAKANQLALSPKQAQRLVDGIWFKNTQENFAHFGLQGGASVQLLEDIIANITKVLTATGSMRNDPTDGRPNELYYDKILSQLQASDFHPGLSSEAVRDDAIRLEKLTEQQWKVLVPVGTLSVPELVFARGTDALIESSKRVLDELVRTMDSLPTAYLSIRGNASMRGDADANRKLAESRAKAAEQYLVAAGIDANRVRAEGGEPTGQTSVSFVIGQLPY